MLIHLKCPPLLHRGPGFCASTSSNRLTPASLPAATLSKLSQHLNRAVRNTTSENVFELGIVECLVLDPHLQVFGEKPNIAIIHAVVSVCTFTTYPYLSGLSSLVYRFHNPSGLFTNALLKPCCNDWLSHVSPHTHALSVTPSMRLT